MSVTTRYYTSCQITSLQFGSSIVREWRPPGAQEPRSGIEPHSPDLYSIRAPHTSDRTVELGGWGGGWGWGGGGCLTQTHLSYCNMAGIWLIDWLYQSFTAQQHQKGHTVPKQVSPLDDDDDITESTRKNVIVLQSHILKISPAMNKVMPTMICGQIKQLANL